MPRERTERILEHSVLLACAAADNDAHARGELRMLAGRKPDWNYLLKTASVHGMLPLLRRGLEDSGSEVSPALIRACAANTARNLAIAGEMLRIVSLLEERGIECIPFKGPALAEMLFGSVAMRQFCDIDVLVRPSDILAARQVLLSRGYRAEFDLTPEREAEYIRSEHAFQFRSDGFVLELHWRFGSKDQCFPVDAADVWKRLDVSTFQGRSIRALSNRDLLLYLCMHGAKHGWERLEWICSFARLAAMTEIGEWSGVFESARQIGCLRGLHLALLLARNVCALRLTSELEAQIDNDAPARKLAEQSQANLFAPPISHDMREFRRHRYYLNTRERLIDRARIVFFSSARIPHPLARDWDLFRLPASMSFLYYLLRPIRLCRDYGLRLLQG